MVRYMLGLIAAATATMLLSFFSVRYLLTASEPRGANGAAVREARELREFSNELVRLTGGYVSRTEKRGAVIRGDLVGWNARIFGPQLRDLRSRMADTKTSSPALTGLLQAADRLTTSSVRPEDKSLRYQASNAVLDAAAAAEARIRALGAEDALVTVPAAPGFGYQGVLPLAP